MRRRLAGLSERDWRAIDRALAIALLVLAEANVFLTESPHGPVIGNVVTVAFMALALLWRRTHAFEALIAVLAGAAVMSTWFTPPPDMSVLVLIIVSACYAAGRHEEGRLALIGFVLGVGTVATLAAIYDPGDVIWPAVFFAGVPWLAGRTLRNQTVLARELAEKAERAQHAREEEERRAIAAERSRIARELHDVLAHNLSVMVVQAGAARRIVERDPDRASEAAELIQRTGREALAELRHLFGTVRRGEGEDLSGPPSIARVEELAKRAGAAGMRVRLSVEGDPVALPAGVDLAAYRLVQEALTNSLKHAGSAEASILVSYEPNELVICVEDDGTPEDEGDGLGDTGGGHGLAGMRERVELYGGVMQVGPRENGGFAVRARLPTRPLVPA